MTENDYYADRLYAIKRALADWPRLPDAFALCQLPGEWPEDWKRGREMQNELGFAAVPPNCETEIGAGFWDRVTDGAWRQERTK